MKRKVRIAAGGLQTVGRLKELLNPFRFGWLSIQYISHKVLRWTIAPIAVFCLLFINFFTVLNSGKWGFDNFYSIFFYFQAFMYLLAIVGWVFERYKVPFQTAFCPFLFHCHQLCFFPGLGPFSERKTIG